MKNERKIKPDEMHRKEKLLLFERFFSISDWFNFLLHVLHWVENYWKRLIYSVFNWSMFAQKLDGRQTGKFFISIGANQTNKRISIWRSISIPWWFKITRMFIKWELFQAKKKQFQMKFLLLVEIEGL